MRHERRIPVTRARGRRAARRAVLLGAALAGACGPRPAPGPGAQPAPNAAAALGPDRSLLDPSVDPCDDLYAYACGGFVRRAVVPPERERWGTYDAIGQSNEAFLRDVLERAARGERGPGPPRAALGAFYAACVDEEAVERAGLGPVRPLVDAIAAVSDGPSLARALGKLHRHGLPALFGFAVRPERHAASRLGAAIEHGGLGLPEPDYYAAAGAHERDVRAAYAGHVARLLALAGAPDAPAAAARVLRFEAALARASLRPAQRFDPAVTDHRLAADELARLAPTFAWSDYFDELGVRAPAAIEVDHPPFFAALDELWRAEGPATLRPYLLVRLVGATAAHLPRAFADEGAAFERALGGRQRALPRWQACLRATARALPEQLAEPFVAARLGPEGARRAEAIAAQLRAALRAGLADLPWMDAATRRGALAKVEALSISIGAPRTTPPPTFVPSREHARNVLAAAAGAFARDAVRLGGPTDRTRWELGPTEVNGSYDPARNAVFIAAGALQPPLFGARASAAVNFGATGAFIGHELAHALDEEGRLYDAGGNLQSWWTPSAEAAFGEALRCVVDKYSAYEIAPGLRLDGALTASENLADIAGLKYAHLAFRAATREGRGGAAAGASAEEDRQFFVAYAQSWCSVERPERQALAAKTDPHAPSRFRVNGPASELPAFASAFGCRPGRPLSPARRCAAW